MHGLTHWLAHAGIHVAVLAVSILALTRFLRDVQVKGTGPAILVALVFSVLNLLLGWLIRALLYVPTLLTLGLLSLFVPLIVNAVVLWLTDKLVASFEIKSGRALVLAAAVISVANWLLGLVLPGPRLG
jgi:putative membrane protein